MLTKARIKFFIWLGFSFLLLVGGLWAFGALSGWAAEAQRQADPAAALNLPPAVPDEAQADLLWLPDDADTGRKMEPYTRRQIESAYVRAWGQWNDALAKGDSTGLPTYFVGPGLTAVVAGVDAAVRNGFQVSQRNLSHALQLHVYAADGSIVAFTDTEAEIVQVIQDEAGQTVLTERVDARVAVVMFLEDGNWRIRHWRWLP